MPFGPLDALVLVDIQNDFLPGGALAVPGGDEILPVLKQYLRYAVAGGAQTTVTRDWHPTGHVSFDERGGPWPPHCIQGTWGAELSSALCLPAEAVLVQKGTDPDRDAYSAFEGTTMEVALRTLGVERLLVGGLATDYCVLRTVCDGRARGFDVVLLVDAVRGIDRDQSWAAIAEMVARGASVSSLSLEGGGA